jgi:hypothetical protein
MNHVEIIMYRTMKLDRYATVPYFPLIIQDDRDEVKETKVRPISGYKLQLSLFAALRKLIKWYKTDIKLTLPATVKNHSNG